MTTYRMSPDGEWIRVNPDGSKWQISEGDDGISGRPPRMYRGIPQDKNSAKEEGADSIKQEAIKPEPRVPGEPSDLNSDQEPALGTDLELPLPERYRALPLPIQYAPISSVNNSEAYRIVELKEEFIAYKEQYRIFRQFIESPNKIELDNGLDSINWPSVGSSPKVQIGKRGGRYTIAIAKGGRYYRRYF